MGYRFAAPLNNAFNTYIGRADFRASSNQTFFGRANFQDDTIVSVPQYPGEAANTTRTVSSRGFAFGWDSVLSSSMVNTFRYGLTQINETIGGLAKDVQVDFRNIDALVAQTATSSRDIPTNAIVDDMSWIKGSHTFKFGRHGAIHPRRQLEQLELVPHPAGQRLVGGRRRHDVHARRAVPGAVERGV